MAREASTEFGDVFRSFEAKLDGEQLLTDELVKRKLHAGEDSSMDLSFLMGNGSELRLTCPAKLSPVTPNKIDVAIRINEPTVGDVPKVVTMLWQSTDRSFSDLVRLEQRGNDEWHEGNLVVDGIEELQDMPRAQLTFFAEANPLIIRTINFNDA